MMNNKKGLKSATLSVWTSR